MTKKENKDDLQEYVDEKAAFQALEKQVKYESGLMREKDDEFRINYSKSTVKHNRDKFESIALLKFGDMVMRENLTKKGKLLNKNKKNAFDLIKEEKETED